jgi:hypothetical protein
MKLEAMFSALVLAVPLTLATSATGRAEQAPAASPAKSLGVYAYPRKQQTESQQAKDEKKCYGSAKKQTGVDPQVVAATPPTAGNQPNGSAARGAARGAAGGAVIGAITGSPGTGAAVGATAGAVHGKRQQRHAEEQAASQAQAQQLDSFKRSFSACMEARGYSVK